MDDPVMTGASKAQIAEWCQRGKEVGATFCVIKRDTFSNEYFPIWTSEDEDVKAIANRQPDAMTKTMEVYDLSKPLEPQLDEDRAINIGD